MVYHCAPRHRGHRVVVVVDVVVVDVDMVDVDVVIDVEVVVELDAVDVVVPVLVEVVLDVVVVDVAVAVLVLVVFVFPSTKRGRICGRRSSGCPAAQETGRREAPGGITPWINSVT